MMRLFAAATAAAVVGGTAWGLTTGATTQETADRAERRVVSPTPPPPTARETCNGLTYRAYDAAPVVVCYRAVAVEQGWPESKVAAWEPFLITEFSGVTQGESSQCWNLRGGDRIQAGELCVNVRRSSSPSDDTGWGQATRSLWGRDAVLCTEFGVCSWQQIVASPYDSMLNSVVRVVDHSGGSRAWCWSPAARAYHECWEAPDR